MDKREWFEYMLYYYQCIFITNPSEFTGKTEYKLPTISNSHNYLLTIINMINLNSNSKFSDNMKIIYDFKNEHRNDYRFLVLNEIIINNF